MKPTKNAEKYSYFTITKGGAHFKTVVFLYQA